MEGTALAPTGVFGMRGQTGLSGQQGYCKHSLQQCCSEKHPRMYMTTVRQSSVAAVCTGSPKLDNWRPVGYIVVPHYTIAGSVLHAFSC